MPYKIIWFSIIHSESHGNSKFYHLEMVRVQSFSLVNEVVNFRNVESNTFVILFLTYLFHFNLFFVLSILFLAMFFAFRMFSWYQMDAIQIQNQLFRPIIVSSQERTKSLTSIVCRREQNRTPRDTTNFESNLDLVPNLWVCCIPKDTRIVLFYA